MLPGNFLLQALDLVVSEFDDIAGLDTHHVIVVFAFVDLEHGVTALEVVPGHQPRRFELGKHPVNGRQPDIFPGVEKFLVYVFGAQVSLLAAFQDFENLESRQRYFQAGFSEFLTL
jgi:hypothetical protein